MGKSNNKRVSEADLLLCLFSARNATAFTGIEPIAPFFSVDCYCPMDNKPTACTFPQLGLLLSLLIASPTLFW